jgi:hypothetical protein
MAHGSGAHVVAPVSATTARPLRVRVVTRGVRCKAHKHDSIVAEENHHLRPQSRGGTLIADNMRYLCANAHGDTHYLLDLIEKNAKPMVGKGADPDDPIDQIPWSVARTYGPGVRDAAYEGWAMYAEGFLRGVYVRHAALWLSNGQPVPRAFAGGRTPVIPYAVAATLGTVETWLTVAESVARILPVDQ